jgi:hypothetical protein
MVKNTTSRPCLIACFGASVFGRRNNLHHPLNIIERPSARRRTSIHEDLVLLLRVACPSEDLQYVSQAVVTRLKHSYPQDGASLLDVAVWRYLKTINYLPLTERFTARRSCRLSHCDVIIVIDWLVLEPLTGRFTAKRNCCRSHCDGIIVTDWRVLDPLIGRFTAKRNCRRSHRDGIIVTDWLVLDHQADRYSARIQSLRGEISKV